MTGSFCWHRALEVRPRRAGRNCVFSKAERRPAVHVRHVFLARTCQRTSELPPPAARRGRAPAADGPFPALRVRAARGNAGWCGGSGSRFLRTPPPRFPSSRTPHTLSNRAQDFRVPHASPTPALRSSPDRGHPTWARRHLTVTAICVSPETSDAEHLFTCSSATCAPSWRNVYSRSTPTA